MTHKDPDWETKRVASGKVEQPILHQLKDMATKAEVHYIPHLLLIDTIALIKSLKKTNKVLREDIEARLAGEAAACPMKVPSDG